MLLLFLIADLGSATAPYQASDGFVFDGDTSAYAGSFFDSYACASDKPEAGPEIVFELSLSEESDLDLIVETSTAAIDVDVHLLGSLAKSGTRAADCLARADKNVTVFHLAAGKYFIVADTYGASAAKAGAFRLYARVYPSARVTWTDVARGVRWGRGSFNEAGGFSVLNLLDVDATQGARVELVDNGACKKLGAVNLPARAVAATNAGFFTGSCAPDGLLRVSGTTIEAAKGSQHAIGLQADGSATYEKPAAGSAFTQAPSAVGSFGYFDLRSATPLIDEDGTTFGRVRHPRTVIHSAPLRLGLFTLDGRSDAGLGATFTHLQSVLAGVGAKQGLNLDGGGSSAMWVKGEPMGGIVNYPSDSTTVVHGGVRAVRSLAVVFADAIVRPPFFVTLPERRTLHDGEVLRYAARAVAPGGEAVSYALRSPPPKAGWSAGELVFAPDGAQNGVHALALEACAAQACTVQVVSVTVAMTPVVAPSGATGGVSGTTGASGVAGEAGTEVTPSLTEQAAPQGDPPAPEVRRGCAGCQSSLMHDPAMPIALLLLGFLRGRSKSRASRLHDRYGDDERPRAPA
ncbi:MAG: phosphodiester glycosidase family protein [Deltaproteobacteria bacterium]|nr:phosphodiester glycosidase family protein [Deltaproteobacteria bacterium]